MTTPPIKATRTPMPPATHNDPMPTYTAHRRTRVIIKDGWFYVQRRTWYGRWVDEVNESGYVKSYPNIELARQHAVELSLNGTVIWDSKDD